MKTKFITRFAFGLFLFMISVAVQAQMKSVNLGTVKNGVATLTNPEGAVSALKANLPATATVSDVKLEYSEYEAAYYLTGKVSNDAITSIGIKLNLDGSTLRGVAGPGVELSCIGFDCHDCRLRFIHWAPNCICNDPNPNADTRCDMTSRYIVAL